MINDTLLTSTDETSEGEISIDYIKAPQFRITWLDGAIGSHSPSGNIQVTFYAERASIPQRQVFKIDEDGVSLGEEVRKKRISRESIVREMSIDAMMTPETAESLGQFLIEISKQAMSERDEK